MAKAKSDASITYRFTSSRAGYAEDTVTLTGDSAGKYTLCWADDTAAFADGYPYHKNCDGKWLVVAYQY